jgi:FkbM family methyltransferase
LAAMRRPLPLTLLPVRLRLALWARLYRGSARRWPSLYEDATLHFAPRVAMHLIPGDVISDCIAFTGAWELRLSRRLARLARHGGTMVEVGANLGYFSLLWAALADGNTCVALEPSPRNVGILRRNVSRNGLDARVTIMPVAAGRERGKHSFDVGPPDQTGWGGFVSGSDPGSLSVDVVRVDEVVMGDADAALMKIDAEGADTWVLMGCERLLRQRRVREIWYEQNKPRMRRLGIGDSEAAEFLGSVGYTPRAEDDPSSDVVTWSARPGRQAP